MYKFRKIIGKYDFPYHFKKIIVRCKKIGYNIDVLQQIAFLVVVPRRKSKGTIVMGSSVRPSVCPSVDTILSPQLLLQFLRDFDETFQLLFP